MSPHQKHKPSCKVWIEYKARPVLGKGGAEILQAIAEENSLSKAALTLGMSYRYLWNYIQETQKVLQARVVETFKGGKAGGGGARLTELGRSLLEEYQRVESHLRSVLSDIECWQMTMPKMNAPNQLKGKVLSIDKNKETAEVKIEIKAPSSVTALITKEAIKELGMKVEDEVYVIVKSTELLIRKKPFYSTT